MIEPNEHNANKKHFSLLIKYPTMEKLIFRENWFTCLTSQLPRNSYFLLKWMIFPDRSKVPDKATIIFFWSFIKSNNWHLCRVYGWKTSFIGSQDKEHSTVEGKMEK